MKIVHFITRLILGGAQENTVLSCEGQHAAGHEVTLAFGPIYGPEGSLAERAKAGGYRLVELPAMVRPLHPLKDIACLKQCKQLIRQIGPDVVHTHSSKAGIVARAAAWRLDVPAVVHTIHGLAFGPYQAAWKNKLYIALERYAAGRCHRIVSVADAMTRQALDAGIGTPDQYTTIYSGMEVEHYLHGPADRAATRAALGIADDELVIGTVARLAELKGHDDLIDVLPRLIEAAPRLKLLWVGDGWWRDRLTRRLVDAGLTDRVVMTGLVPPDHVPRYIRAMDVLAHPSYREGLPRTVPQALLCGVPVATYDCDGAGEVCLDGQTGRLVPTGDTAALGEALVDLLADANRRLAMARAGRELCGQRFDAARMVSQLDALYRHVLQTDAPSNRPA